MRSRPGLFVQPIRTMRRHLASRCPVLATVHIRMELERVVLLITPDARTRRSIRAVRAACKEYRAADYGDWTHCRTQVAKALRNLEATLQNATPSIAATRMGLGWPTDEIGLAEET